MAAPIVYTDVAEGADLNGQLFSGVKFWVAHRVPSRTHYMDLITANGGQIVLLEKKADYMIADHLWKYAPPGSISYTFIDASIQQGEMVDPDAHLAGPERGTARDVGSRSRPVRGGRRPFTAEEDRILYTWVRDCEKNAGGNAGGNVIYQKLEEKYPQHPWQSWRDRYRKQLKDRPPSSFGLPNNAPPTPPNEQTAELPSSSRLVPNKEEKPSSSKSTTATKEASTKSTAVTKEASNKSTAATKKAPTKPSSVGQSKKHTEYTSEELVEMFTLEDWENIYANVPGITENEDNDALWDGWAATNTKTAEQWKQYFRIVVRPQWEQDGEWKREQVVRIFEERMAREAEAEEAEEAEEEEESMEKNVEQDQAQKSGKNGAEDEIIQETGETGPSTKDKGKGKRQSQQKGAEIEGTEAAEKTGPLTSKPSSASFAVSQVNNAGEEESLVLQYLEKRKGKKAGDAYVFYALERKFALWTSQPSLDYTGLHAILLPQWNALSDEEKAPYLVMEAADKKRHEIENADPLLDVKLDTICQETSQDNTKSFEKRLKRTRGTEAEVEQVEVQSDFPYKRRKHANLSPSQEDSVIPKSSGESIEQEAFTDAQQQPLFISSRETSSASDSQSESADQFSEQDQDMEVTLQHELQPQEADRLTDTSEIQGEEEDEEEEVRTPQPEELDITSSSNYPSNTPTPRAPRTKPSNFDTQAILSSPIDVFPLGRLPRLEGMTQALQSQSQAQEEESQTGDESVEPPSPLRVVDGGESPTNSLQEFRRSLNGIPPSEDSIQGGLFAPIPRPARSSSPAQSEESSSESGDPDPPLGPEEFDDYFAEMHEEGFDDVWITAALKHTRCRPDLTTVVLNAWKVAAPLPDQRGVWSIEDDEDLESGDVEVLERLEGKHSMDGWGGITERLRFLERYRGK